MNYVVNVKTSELKVYVPFINKYIKRNDKENCKIITKTIKVNVTATDLKKMLEKIRKEFGTRLIGVKVLSQEKTNEEENNSGK